MRVLQFARLALLSGIAAYLLLLGIGAFHLIDGWTDAISAALMVFVMAVSALAIVVTQLMSWARKRQS